MEMPLLQTKFYIPMTRPPDATGGLRTGFIPRLRLIDRLNQGLSGKLTLISAPAGFGKTTLVSHWLEQIDRPAAWLALDQDDNDLARFLRYLIAALQTIQPAVGPEVLALLQSSPRPPGRTLLTLLINDLTAIADKSLLVLDDYHLLDTDAIDQAMTYFIDHLPPTLHLALTTRADPNLPLARLRANGQMSEIRSADLRFTPLETARFLAQMTGLSLTPAEVAALDRRTDGWIAGLQMAALSLGRRETEAVAQFIDAFSGSHHYIMDYLVDEVLHQQPAEIQAFLLYTSILDRLCAPLCEAIWAGVEPSGHGRDAAASSILPNAPRAQDTLAYLEHANLFINPLDHQRRWYRYHPLFADLLRHRLQQTYPDRITTLHLSASQWYEQAGLMDAAIQHALAAQTFGRAAALVEEVASAMLQRSELTRLLAWLDLLPAEVIEAQPLLGLYYCWGLFLSGQIEPAVTRLEAIEARLEADETHQTAEVQAHAAAMRAYLMRETGDLASTITLSRQALAHLPRQDSLLEAMVALNLAIAYYLQGEFEPAAQQLSQIMATGQSAQLMANTLSAIYLNAQLLRAQGNLQQALRLCHEGLALVARHGWHHFPAVGFLYVVLGDLLRETNDLPPAADYLEKGLDLGQAGGHPHILIAGHAWLARLRQTQGDVTGSQAAMGAALQLEQQYEVSRFWPLPSAANDQARLWIAQGNLAAANRWAQASSLHPADTSIPYLDEAAYLTLARLRIAEGDFETAEPLLRRLHQAAAAAKRHGSLIEILILQALTFAAQKRGEKAVATLAQALGLAEPEAFARVFLDEGEPLAALLRRAVAQGLHAPYALHLLNAWGETTPAPPSLIEPLSERELEVLRRVAAGYSNKEIAEELVVAVSTVKRHISNIYGKLEAASRTQAVAKARELKLL
ncbi:MAG: tetratricopeptide repeat protein [Anaerolineaceae bacterium]|nr:tetratricopeptide repeat protein [Anaerolineaceae bacterium]